MAAANAFSRVRKRGRLHGGFLLTETLATFTISAFVLLGLVSASSVLLRAVDRSVAYVQDTDDLGRTLAAITRDVSGLARARWNGYEPQAFVFRGGPNSLFFARVERGPDGSSETRVVALREIVAGKGTRLVRSEATLRVDASSFDALHFGPQRDLGSGPARLRFYYVGAAVEGKAAPPRSRDWPMGRVLPEAIIVEAVASDTGRVILSTRVEIRANADIGCLPVDKATSSTGGVPAPGGVAGAEVPSTDSTQTALAAATPPGTVLPAAVAESTADGGAEDDGFCGRLDHVPAKKDDQKGEDQNAVASNPGLGPGSGGGIQ